MFMDTDQDPDEDPEGMIISRIIQEIDVENVKMEREEKNKSGGDGHVRFLFFTYNMLVLMDFHFSKDEVYLSVHLIYIHFANPFTFLLFETALHVS